MHLLGNRIHALIGLWVLAGLVVAGINGFILLTLLDEPLVGHSRAVRNADQAFRHYRVLLASESEKIASGMDLLASWFNPAVVEAEKPAVQNRPEARSAAKPAPPAVKLPQLTGIMTSRSTDGATRHLALMDGRVWTEGDRLRDLTVKRIGSRGVRLVRGDRTWFLKAPAMAYSLTTQ